MTDKPGREAIEDSIHAAVARINGWDRLESVGKILREEFADVFAKAAAFDWLERWLREDPTRWQIAIRRLEVSGEYLFMIVDESDGRRSARQWTFNGHTLLEAVRKAMEKANAD